MLYARILTMAKLFQPDNFSSTHIFWMTRAKKYFPTEDLSKRNGHTQEESWALHMGLCFERFSQVIYGKQEIFFLAQEVYDTLEQEETQLLISVHPTLQSGTRAVDPTLFSPDIIVESDERKTDFWKRFLKKKRIAEDDQVMLCMASIRWA